MLLIKLITLVFGLILTGHLHRPENSSALIRSPLGNILEQFSLLIVRFILLNFRQCVFQSYYEEERHSR